MLSGNGIRGNGKSHYGMKVEVCLKQRHTKPDGQPFLLLILKIIKCHDMQATGGFLEWKAL